VDSQQSSSPKSTEILPLSERNSVLDLRNITAAYGEALVLRNVDLRVQGSTVVALLGANGAGKTTLLRVASGFIRPESGQILLNGEDVTTRSMHRRVLAGLCHIPEGRGIFPSLTVRENLTVFSPKGREREAFDIAIDTFPVLGIRSKQIAGNLSGGEQQMLALVRAYMTNPSLVLVDEASMGLAPQIIDQLYEFLLQITSGGTSLLLVEQYIDRALDLAEQVYILNQGQVVFCGASNSVDRDQVFEHYLGISVNRH
jgi:branched-chain amino acid transport system ATP-binding protein